MKIRKGFVSNSSSSSFIIIGFRIDDYDELREYKNKYDDKQINSKNFYAAFEDDIFGLLYADLEYVIDEIDLDDMLSCKQQLQELFPDEEIKVFAGEFST